RGEITGNAVHELPHHRSRGLRCGVQGLKKRAESLLSLQAAGPRAELGGEVLQVLREPPSGGLRSVEHVADTGADVTDNPAKLGQRINGPVDISGQLAGLFSVLDEPVELVRRPRDGVRESGHRPRPNTGQSG